MGVAVMSRTCGATALAGQRLAFGDAEAMLLVDDDEAQVGEPDRLLERARGYRPRRGREIDPRSYCVGAPSRSSASSRCGGRQRAGQQRHVVTERLEQGAQRLRMLARQQVGRRQQRGLMAGVGDQRHRDVPRPRSCPSRRRPGAGASSAAGRPRSARMSSSAARWSSVRRHGRIGLDVRAGARAPRRDLLGDDRLDAADHVLEAIVVRERIGCALLALALALARDHAHLEREQLVERQAAQRVVAAARSRAESGSIRPRRARRRAAEVRARRSRRSARGRYSGCVGSASSSAVSDARPKRRRGDAGRQPVDRHDAAGVERLAAGARRTRGSGSAAASRAARPCR